MEIVKKASSGGKRSVTFRGVSHEPELLMDVRFFCQKSGRKLVEVLKEDTRLRSESDRYFIFFRPLQDCYVYILQEDSTDTVSLIFPE